MRVPLNVHADRTDWTVESIEELDQRLDEIASESERPTVASIDLGDHGTIDVVLGKGRSWIQFCPNAQDPPYWVSLGEVDSEGVFVFFLDDHWTEAPIRNTIPIAVAREVVRGIVENGSRPPVIAWEEI